MISRFGRAWTLLFAAALYGGPVLAGLAGHGWNVLPVFAALFLVYVVATRKPDLSTPAGWAGLAIMAAVQIGLVALTWGAGLALSGVVAPIALPLWAPLAITGLAAGFGAWAWRDAAEMNVMLDSAIREIEAMRFSAPAGDPWQSAPPAAQDAFERFLESLDHLDGLTPDAIDPLVQRLEAEAGPHAFDLLYDESGAGGDTNDPTIDFALLRYVAIPAVLRHLIDRGEAGLAPTLMLSAADATVRHEARARVADLIAAGAPAEQLPDPAWLESLAADYPDEGFDTLRDACRAQDDR